MYGDNCKYLHPISSESSQQNDFHYEEEEEQDNHSMDERKSDQDCDSNKENHQNVEQANNLHFDKKKEIKKIDRDCGICYHKSTKLHVFIPCGHIGICEDCSKQIMKDTKTCPFCNEHIKESYRTYDVTV